MTGVAIEINDAGLVAVDEKGVRSEPSPGYALLDGERLLAGAQAQRQARLRPRLVHSRFWDSLDTAALGPPFPDDRSAADLVHAHLVSLGDSLRVRPRTVLLAVPGHYAEAQLGLLLGVARAARLPVRGMVDAAVAAAAGRSAREKLLHLDVQLHRVVVTELLQGRELVRGRVETIDGVGLVFLHDAWARAIAEAFVRQTRFDPLHRAEAEQALHDRLPAWLATLRRDAVARLALRSGEREHAVELARERLLEAVDAAYGRIAQCVGAMKRVGEPAALLSSRRVAELPGLAERLSGLRELERLELDPGSAAAGALRWRERIESGDEALPLVTRLPRELLAPPDRDEAPARHEPAAPRAAGRAPTHLLLGAVAHPIGEAPLTLGVAVPEGRRGLNLSGDTEGVSRTHCSVYRAGHDVLVQDSSSYGTFLNGERIEGRATLVAGDRLRVGSPGIELTLIAVEDGPTATD